VRPCSIRTNRLVPDGEKDLESKWQTLICISGIVYRHLGKIIPECTYLELHKMLIKSVMKYSTIETQE